jgi:hypothetical protein
MINACIPYRPSSSMPGALACIADSERTGGKRPMLAP